MPTPSEPNTDLGYTGQRNLDADIGLMDYKARFYSAYINRFIQPDSLIPDPVNPQAWNRYSYVVNNPTNHIDPTGHQYQAVIIPATVLVIGVLALAYVVGTPPETVQRDMQNIGYAIDRFGRNFKNNAATISDSITHLSADKLDPTKPAENVLPGSLKRKFPTGLLGKSLNEIEEALKKATGKEKSDLKTAKKILEQVKRLLQKPK